MINIIDKMQGGVNVAKVKALFHIDEKEKWSLLLINVRNLLLSCEKEDLEIEVMANADAVEAYTEDFELSNVMRKQNAKGIRFVACDNAIKAHNMKREEILDFVELVPVGVLEIVERQQEGFAYIKP